MLLTLCRVAHALRAFSDSTTIKVAGAFSSSGIILIRAPRADITMKRSAGRENNLVRLIISPELLFTALRLDLLGLKYRAAQFDFDRDSFSLIVSHPNLAPVSPGQMLPLAQVTYVDGRPIITLDQL